jgi:hypothetical protein
MGVLMTDKSSRTNDMNSTMVSGVAGLNIVADRDLQVPREAVMSS